MSADNCILCWKFLNDNAGAIQAISAGLSVAVTLVLVILTIKYVLLTNRLAKASESQLKFLRESEQVRLKQETIDAALRSLYRINRDTYRLRLMKDAYLSIKSIKISSPEQQRELLESQRKFLDEVDKMNVSQLFPELMLVSFQVRCLENIDLWKDFQPMAELFKKMIEVLIDSENIEDLKKYDEINSVYLDKMEDFIKKCLKISKAKEINVG